MKESRNRRIRRANRGRGELANFPYRGSCYGRVLYDIKAQVYRLMGSRLPGRSFACHHSDFMSSDNCQAASGASRLRRTTLSTRSHETKSLTSPGVMPSVGMVTCKQPFSALTAIMVKICSANAGLSKRALPTCSSSRFGHFATTVGCGVTRDRWRRDVSGWAGEGLGTRRKVLEPAGGG